MDLELRNLNKSFDSRPVLTNFSHVFPDGSLTCIVGPSGCGKTTLLRLILGLWKAESGEIIGRPARCAAVFQEDRLIEHLSAHANIRVALRHDFPTERIFAALEAVRLHDELSKPVRELSGGQKRRVAILRALLAEADLLVMDEPFKGLDIETRDTVLRFALPLLKGRTTLIVTHDPLEADMLGGSILKIKND